MKTAGKKWQKGGEKMDPAVFLFKIKKIPDMQRKFPWDSGRCLSNGDDLKRFKPGLLHIVGSILLRRRK